MRQPEIVIFARKITILHWIPQRCSLKKMHAVCSKQRHVSIKERKNIQSQDSVAYNAKDVTQPDSFFLCIKNQHKNNNKTAAWFVIRVWLFLCSLRLRRHFYLDCLYFFWFVFFICMLRMWNIWWFNWPNYPFIFGHRSNRLKIA